MKHRTDEMLSDSLTKVMTIPAHHVQKCGLKDLRDLKTVSGMVVLTQIKAVEATAVATYTAATYEKESGTLMMKI